MEFHVDLAVIVSIPYGHRPRGRPRNFYQGQYKFHGCERRGIQAQQMPATQDKGDLGLSGALVCISQLVTSDWQRVF
jgi:hypothetical protein